MRSGGILGACVVVAAAACIHSPAEEPRPKDELARLAEVLALPAGALDLNERPWVAVHRKWAGEPADLHGWLVDDGEETLKVMEIDGALHGLGKPRAGEKQPADFREDWMRRLRKAPDVAWVVKKEDFTADAKRFLAAGPPPKEKIERGDQFFVVQSRERIHIHHAAYWAVAALRLGEAKLAAELHAQAESAHRAYARTYINVPEPLDRFLVDTIARDLYNRAVDAGHYETPRRELQTMWKRLRETPGHRYVDEAKAMEAHYQRLLEEDARWVEPSTEAIAKFTPAQAAEYWIYKLRDHDAYPNSDPGYCDVFGPGWKPPPRGETRSNPAVELAKLGTAAAPLLIAHLEDSRPTRCLHWSRSYALEGRYLLRYGDCCCQILRRIGGEKVLPEYAGDGYADGAYPMRKGKGAELKKHAEKWLAERKQPAPE